MVAANRGEVTASGVDAYVAEQASHYDGRIVAVALDEAHGRMASSDARARIAGGEGSGDVPAEVAAYIREHGLYEGT